MRRRREDGDTRDIEKGRETNEEKIAQTAAAGGGGGGSGGCFNWVPRLGGLVRHKTTHLLKNKLQDAQRFVPKTSA